MHNWRSCNLPNVVSLFYQSVCNPRNEIAIIGLFVQSELREAQQVGIKSFFGQLNCPVNLIENVCCGRYTIASSKHSYTCITSLFFWVFFLAVFFSNNSHEQSRASAGSAGVHAAVLWRSSRALWPRWPSPWHAYCCLYGCRGKKPTFKTFFHFKNF